MVLDDHGLGRGEGGVFDRHRGFDGPLDHSLGRIVGYEAAGQLGRDKASRAGMAGQEIQHLFRFPLPP